MSEPKPIKITMNKLVEDMARKNPKFRKFARLGLGKAALRGLSRAGIAGLGASLAIQGIGLLDD